MSTKFYLVEDPCPHCGKGRDISIAIRVNAGDMTTALCLYGYENESIADCLNNILSAWNRGSLIRDEYGDTYTYGKFLELAQSGKSIAVTYKT